MGLWKSLKGDHPDKVGDNSQHANASSQPLRDGKSSTSALNAAPSYDTYKASSSTYASPPGLPPYHSETKYQQDSYRPPPGPPPSHDTDQPPPPYHDWTVIPDTALLPPPPALDNETSPTGNAEYSEAIRAHRWCHQRPLLRPRVPHSSHLADAQNGNISLVQPREYSGKLKHIGVGNWRGQTRAGSKDSLLLSHIPLYFAAVESPMQTERRKLFYFEVKILGFGRTRGDENALAIGYCAIPTPTWRMPGWERGSIGVHSDDGRRYISDTEGGKDFTRPFRTGDTVGIGITFDIPKETPYTPSNQATLNGQVIFTRNGQRDGGWDIHEQLDAGTEFGVLGIDGTYDLFGAVGVFGEVEFEVRFCREDWMWTP